MQGLPRRIYQETDSRIVIHPNELVLAVWYPQLGFHADLFGREEGSGDLAVAAEHDCNMTETSQSLRETAGKGDTQWDERSRITRPSFDVDHTHNVFQLSSFPDREAWLNWLLAYGKGRIGQLDL